jgi:hypothetical protein
MIYKHEATQRPAINRPATITYGKINVCALNSNGLLDSSYRGLLAMGKAAGT